MFEEGAAEGTAAMPALILEGGVLVVIFTGPCYQERERERERKYLERYEIGFEKEGSSRQ